MTLWMIASLAFAAFLAFFGTLGDRSAARFGMPRRFVWMIVAAFAIAVPFVEAFRPLRVESPVAPTGQFNQAGHRAVGTTPIAVASASREHSRIEPPSRVAIWLERVRRGDPFVVALWGVASLVLLTRLFGSLLVLRRESRTWREVSEQVGPVLLTPNAGPAVTGFVRPRIVMPCWMLDEDPATRAMLLRHELEHVRAGDTRVLFATAVLDAVFPWNLPVRWMLRRLRLAIEIDCDQRVIRAVGGAGRYGLALLRVGERYATPLPAAACLHSSMIDLEVRIRAMASRQVRRPIAGFATIVGLAAVAMSAGAWMPWPTVRVARPKVQAVEVRRTGVDSISKRVTSSSAPNAKRHQVMDAVSATQAVIAARRPPRTDSSIARARTDSLPPMRDVREWIAQYHPSVIAGDPHVNRVTVVVDGGGRYVRSLADSVSEDALTPPEAVGFFRARRPWLVNASPDVARADTVVAAPRIDPDPWRHVGVASEDVMNMMFSRSRAGSLVPYPLSIIVLQVRRQ